jgi:hypothetical protein
VINNLTKYKLGHLAAAQSLHQAMEFLQTREVRHVVRVLGRSKIALMQFAHATKLFKGQGYKPLYVTSLE